jgi:hypothetical protein
LAYLAASKENKPIYVNRHMADADLVLPIGCLRPSGSFGYCGVHSSWFPAFSDAATQQRYLAPTSSLSSVQHGRRCVEAEEAAWLLGIQMVLEIVPGQGETVHRVLAGTPVKVADQGRRVCDEAWRMRIPQRVDLVIAAIEGDHREQSWENFARALAVALDAVEDGGAILLCTDLRCPPGESLLRLARQEDDAETIRQLQRDRGPDATSASLLCAAFERAQVFLISAHDPSIVEDLGIGYVAGHDEAQRLVKQFKSCLLIPDAQRAGVQVTGDSE